MLLRNEKLNVDMVKNELKPVFDSVGVKKIKGTGDLISLLGRFNTALFLKNDADKLR